MLNLGPISKALRRAIGRMTAEPDVAILSFGLANAKGKIGATIDPTSGSLLAQRPCVTLTDGSTPLPKSSGACFIGGTSAVNIALASPVAGAQAAGGDDGRTITFVALTAQTHGVVCTAGFGASGILANRDKAAFGGAIGDSCTVIAYNGVWYLTATRNVTLS